VSGEYQTQAATLWEDGNPGLKARSSAMSFQRPEGVRSHDILYTLFRDILYTFIYCGRCVGWLGGVWTSRNSGFDL